MLNGRHSWTHALVDFRLLALRLRVARVVQPSGLRVGTASCRPPRRTPRLCTTGTRPCSAPRQIRDDLAVPRQGIHSRGPWASSGRSPSSSSRRHDGDETSVPSMRTASGSYEWAALALITAGAAALRLIAIGKVPPDPFYDAAVRSMGISWHNFSSARSSRRQRVDRQAAGRSVAAGGEREAVRVLRDDAEAARGVRRDRRRAAAVRRRQAHVERDRRARRGGCARAVCRSR